MLCDCCQKLIRLEFEVVGIQVIVMKQGYIEVSFESEKHSLTQIEQILKRMECP